MSAMIKFSKVHKNQDKETMEYNKRIRELRIDNDKNQKAIAEILQTTQSYYSEYELGKRELPLRHLKKLCEFYQVSSDYILGLPKGLSWPREPKD